MTEQEAKKHVDGGGRVRVVGYGVKSFIYKTEDGGYCYVDPDDCEELSCPEFEWWFEDSDEFIYEIVE